MIEPKRLPFSGLAPPDLNSSFPRLTLNERAREARGGVQCSKATCNYSSVWSSVPISLQLRRGTREWKVAKKQPFDVWSARSPTINTRRTIISWLNSMSSKVSITIGFFVWINILPEQHPSAKRAQSSAPAILCSVKNGTFRGNSPRDRKPEDQLKTASVQIKYKL